MSAARVCTERRRRSSLAWVLRRQPWAELTVALLFAASGIGLIISSVSSASAAPRARRRGRGDRRGRAVGSSARFAIGRQPPPRVPVGLPRAWSLSPDSPRAARIARPEQPLATDAGRRTPARRRGTRRRSASRSKVGPERGLEQSYWLATTDLRVRGPRRSRVGCRSGKRAGGVAPRPGRRPLAAHARTARGTGAR
jgi:hypothetical protein